MKKLFALAMFTVLLACSAGNANPDSFYVTVQYADADGSNVKLRARGESQFEDVAQGTLENGEVVLQVDSLDYPQMLIVEISGIQQRFMTFGQNGTLTIHIQNENGQFSYDYSNGEYADVLNAYTSAQEVFNASVQALQQEYGQAMQIGDSLTIVSLQGTYDAAYAKRNRQLVGVAMDASVLGAAIAMQDLYEAEVATLDSIYSNIPVKYGDSPAVAQLKERIASMKRTAIGEPLIDVMHPSPEGDMVRLSEVLGESYTLVDFWASWCGPCRAENPNVVNAYNTYKDRGFTVVGISLDRERGAWVNAIQEDGLTWTHLSDLKFWDSEPAQKYGVRAIPANVMLDENGIIVAKNLREQELQDWLAARL